jgi:hypothetical protein
VVEAEEPVMMPALELRRLEQSGASKEDLVTLSRMMEESMSFARKIMGAYEATRGMGHTTLALNVAEEFGVVLVVYSQGEKRRIARMVTEGVPVDIVPLGRLHRWQAGRSRLFILDNHVIMELAKEAVRAEEEAALMRHERDAASKWARRVEVGVGSARAEVALFALYPDWWKWVGQHLVALRTKIRRIFSGSGTKNQGDGVFGTV